MNETFFIKTMGCAFREIPVGSVFIYCDEVYYKTGNIFCIPCGSSDGEVVEYDCINLETNELDCLKRVEASVCTPVNNVTCK